jgi:hypothetical protein
MSVALAVLAVVAFAAENAKAPVMPGEKTTLFNGHDLAGWLPLVADAKADAKAAWTVRDGVIRGAGRPATTLRTETDYANYRLHVEWRWAAGTGGDAAVLIHVGGADGTPLRAIQCDLRAGDAGDVWLLSGAGVNGEATGRPTRVARKADSNEKPLGEWNTCDVAARGNTVRIVINDAIQNELGGTTATSGRIGLQSAGKAVEFRNVYVEPLDAVPSGPSPLAPPVPAPQRGSR